MWKSLSLTLLLLLATTAAESDKLQVTVTEGPTKDGTCPTPIVEGDYAKIHFTVSIHASSKTGTPNQVMETTTDGGDPIGVTLGHGEVIPAWDEGLVGLCEGDKVTLVVPPHLAYGDEGTGQAPNDIPGGATIQFEIEIVSVLEGPEEGEDEDDTQQATAMFEASDENKDGKLSRAEFDAMFAAQIGEVDDAEEMAAIQKQLDHFWNGQDKDEDGVLSLEEFLSPSSFDDPEYDEMDNPEEEFAALDTDKDGKLSKAEVDVFFQSIGQEVPDDFWMHLDEDEDGFISFEEFFADADSEDFDEEGDEL